MVGPVDLHEEMSPADVLLLMGSVPERINDLVYGMDETRLRYRHGPAFPTLGGLIDLLPASHSLPFHRFIYGLHMAGILLAGIAIGAAVFIQNIAIPGCTV